MSAYQSIFKRRTSPVRAQDFADCANLVVNKKPATEADRLTEDALASWNHYFPLYPQDVCVLFTQNFPQEVNLHMGLGKKGVTFALHGDGPLPTQIEGTIEYAMNRMSNAPRIGDTFIAVHPDLRGKGLGKSWIRSVLELCIALEEPEFCFRAGLANGAYTWAHLGAHIDMNASEADRRYQSIRMLGRLDVLKDFISEQEYKTTCHHCKLRSEGAIQKMAANQAMVPSEAWAALQSADGGQKLLERMENFFKNNPLAGHAPDVAAISEILFICKAFESACERDRPATLSECLLMNTAYDAKYDFGNARQMNFVTQKLGGWKTIQPI